MARIEPGRMTHEHDRPITLFLIGMRFNRPWRVDQWLPVFLAMPRMLEELSANQVAARAGEAEDLGFLGARFLLGARGPTLVQYWRSPEHLYAYAGSPTHVHRPAWTAFNARARRAAGAVGLWHETYAVPSGGHESISVGMPAEGLAKVTRSVPVAGSSRRHARLEDDPPSGG